MVTAGTLYKERLLDTKEKLDAHTKLLFDLAQEFGWELQAWAVFANHYHFVGLSPDEGANLGKFLNKLHSCSARSINRLDGVAGRQVWYQFWDTSLTFERSYLARLNYVHRNAVKHKLVDDPRQYPWCSADWFFQQAERSFHETASSFKTDEVNVFDDFD
jgi:putative transposase